MNKVFLIGNVGREPAVRYLDAGVCVAQVELATTERGYQLQNGTRVPDRTEWHTVVFWRKQAEIVEKYVHKGDKLFVQGKIQTRNWTDRQGASHKSIEIMADELELLSPKADSTSGGHANKENGEDSETVKSSNSSGVVTPSDNNGEYPF